MVNASLSHCPCLVHFHVSQFWLCLAESGSSATFPCSALLGFPTRGSKHLSNEKLNFLDSDVGGVVKASRGEDLDGGDVAEVALEIAVEVESDGGAVVAEVLA